MFRLGCALLLCAALGCSAPEPLVRRGSSDADESGGKNGGAGGGGGTGGFPAATGGAGGGPRDAATGGLSDGGPRDLGSVDGPVSTDVAIQLPPDMAPAGTDTAPPPPDVAPPDRASAPPPDLRPDVAPAAEGMLVVTHAAAVATTNLTTAGTSDWAHWGHPNRDSVNRKANVTNRVSMTVVGTATPNVYTDRPPRYSWTDGTPTASVTGTPNGVYVGGMGAGFELRFNVTRARVRVLKIHVGAWQSRGRLSAQLTDNSAPAYADNSLNATTPGQDRIYTIEVQAREADQELIVRWTVDALNRPEGNVTLQAVTVMDRN